MTDGDSRVVASAPSVLERRLGVRDRVAVVVGGGGGLGRAIAVELGRAGMRLELADANARLLEATADGLVADGVDVETAVFDARVPEALESFIEDAGRRRGRIDTLVNVVGGTFRQPFEASTPRGWDTLIRTNFTWLLHSIRTAMPLMPAGSSIVNLTSIEAHRAAPGHAVYTAMKAAVCSLTMTLAVEFAPRGIRVNAIAADKTASEGILNGIADRRGTGWGDDEASSLANRITIPMGRTGRDSDVGGCALFLASDLSAYVTGTTIHPDGGALAASGWMNWPGAGFTNSVPAPVVIGLAGSEPEEGHS